MCDVSTHFSLGICQKRRMLVERNKQMNGSHVEGHLRCVGLTLEIHQKRLVCEKRDLCVEKETCNKTYSCERVPVTCWYNLSREIYQEMMIFVKRNTEMRGAM